MSTVLLIHPPLLGPAVWNPLRTALQAAGHGVLVPDYSAELDRAAAWWQRAAARCVDEVNQSGTTVDVVVGYSGSGVLVPLVAAAGGPDRAVFLDALVPASGAHTVPGQAIREHVARLHAEHGGDRLPPWTRWWPQGVLAQLVPDPELRVALSQSCPSLPVDFYAESVPVPQVWEPEQVHYLRLSAAYAGAAEQARRRGWTVREIDSDHLAVMTRPEQVMDAVIG